eukprot:COSAG04_NODE_88_length_27314_cov_6.056476_22_plen_277_part_00
MPSQDQLPTEVLTQRLNAWLQLSLNREVPSSLLLLSVAFLLRDSLSISEARGPQAVKIAVLEQKQRRYHAQLKQLQGKIRLVGRDLQRERELLEELGELEELEKSEAVEEQAQREPESEPNVAEAEAEAEAEEERRKTKDQRLLSLLREKEAVAVTDAFEVALAEQLEIEQAMGGGPPNAEAPRALAVEAAVVALHGLLSQDLSLNLRLAFDKEPIREYLIAERGSDDEHRVDFTEFVEGYMELRRRAEERSKEERRAENLARLEGYLEECESRGY